MKKNVLRVFEESPWIWKVLSAFTGTYGICVMGRTMGMKNASYSVLGVAAFISIWIFSERAVKELREISDKRARGRRAVFSAIVCFLFSLSMLWGYQLQNNGMTDGGFRGKGITLFHAACLSVAFFPAGSLFFKQVEKIRPVSEEKSAGYRPAAVFGICAAAIFLCLIPVWLAYYPIVMSYDFHRQVNEAYQGFAYFYPYQPIAHTWVIWVFLKLGTALGSLETGFACMALFQMLLYALVTGYACSMLYRMLKRVWPVAAAALFFGIYPFHSVMVVCTTKDTIFTILFLLFFLLLLEHSLFCGNENGREKGPLWKKKNLIDILLVLEGCLMIQFRNNAFYAAAVFMVLFFLLTPKREKLRIFLLCIFVIAGGRLTGAVIKKAIGTELSLSKVEMFSVPIQQFARVGRDHQDELELSTVQELTTYVPLQSWEYYNPPLADTVKVDAVTENFERDYGRLFSLWIKLGLQYPNEYLDAFLELTRGYWFLDDVSWAENLGYGVEGRMGAVFTYNSSEIAGVGSIRHESKFPWLEARLEEIVSGNVFYDWPVISVLFKSSFFTWALFLNTMAFFYRKQKKQLKLSMLPWLYFGTVLLGPVVQIRYVFPVMVLLPLLSAMLFIKENRDESAAPCSRESKRQVHSPRESRRGRGREQGTVRK